MICPMCDAEVYDLEDESCLECQTAFASWEACSVKFHARPLIRCCRCGECPSPGDRACRQCQAHFLKRVPAWLDAEFPGWSNSDEQTAVSTLSCVCCDMEVLPGRAKCEICGLKFHRPTQDFAVNAGEVGRATSALIFQVEEDLIAAREVTSDLEADDGKTVAPVMPYTHQELGDIIVSHAKAIFGIDVAPTVAIALAWLSQGTAANAIILLKTVVRMAQAETKEKLTGAEITPLLAATSLKRMGLDPWVGLDRSQRKYLVALVSEGGRGISAINLARMTNERLSTIKTMVEPFLLQRSVLPYFDPEDGVWRGLEGAFVERSRSGRKPTILAFKYLEMALERQTEDPDWFAGETLQFGGEVEEVELGLEDADGLLTNDTYTNAPDLSADEFEQIPDTGPQEALAPVSITPPNTVVAPISVAAQPTVVPDLASTRRVRTRGEEIAAAAAVFATRIIPPKAKLLAQRQTSYKALLASGSIRTVPGVKWLSGQSVVCARGHPSNFGLFVHRPGYGTLDSLPDFTPVNWQDRLGAAFQVRGGTAIDHINDRDPELDVRWSLGCPVCGTDQYTFEAAPLRDYAMCTASADYWWVFCHLYRRNSKSCGNCEIRRDYWNALRSLE